MPDSPLPAVRSSAAHLRHRTLAACIAAACVGAPVLLSGHAGAQQTVIPAISDSPTAQTLIGDLATQSASNPAESARIARKLLDEYATRVVRVGAEKDELFRSVADETERFLLEHPEVLTRFRDLESRAADRMLEDEGPEAVAARRRLTPAGLKASLLLAERALRADRPEEAAEELARIASHPDLQTADADAALRDSALLREMIAHASLSAMAARRLGRDRDAAEALARLDALSGSAVGGDGDDQFRAMVEQAREAALRVARGGPPRVGRSPLATADRGGDPDETWREIWSLELDESLFRRTLATGIVARAPRGIENLRLDASRMCAVPTVLGNLIYISEGHRIRAVDADSRDEVWSRSLGSTGGSRDATSVFDLNAIAATARSLVVYEGHAGSNERSGAPRVWCLDPLTGERRWDVVTDGLDGRAELAGLYPVGVPVIGPDVVVVAARKPTQRLEQVDWLLGLDERSGTLRWALSLAGAPSNRGTLGRRIPGIASDGRIVVHATPLGVVTAVRARDGMVAWLRRFPVPLRDARFTTEPWELASPCLVGDRVVAISPDEQEVMAIDAGSGRLLDSRPIGPGTEWGASAYLVASVDPSGVPMVLGVGTDVIAFDARDLSRPIWSFSRAIEGAAPPVPASANRNGIRGRVSVAGGYVVIPTTTEIFLLELATGRVSARVPSGSPGNPLLLDDRMVVAGDEALRVLMPSERAEAVLRERLAAVPDDPSAAIALLELAQVTGRPEAALDAARTAEESIARISRAGVRGSGASDLRAELIDKLAALAVHAPERGDEAYAIAARVATTPELRVRMLIARGDFLRSHARAAEAIECLVTLATDPALESQLTDGEGVQRQVRLESLQRMAQLASRDRDALAVLEQRARSGLDGLGPRPSRDALAAFVRTHPRTTAAAEAVASATHLDPGEIGPIARAALRDNLVPPARADLVRSLEGIASPSSGRGLTIDPATSVDGRISALLQASGIASEPSSATAAPLPKLGRKPEYGLDLRARLVSELGFASETRDRSLMLGLLEGALVRMSGPQLDLKWRLRLDDRDPALLWARDRIVLWQTLPKGEFGALVIDPTDGTVIYSSPMASEIWPRGEDAQRQDLAEGAEPPVANPQRPTRFIGMPPQISPLCDDRSLILVRRDGDLARVGFMDARPSVRVARGLLAQTLAESLDNGIITLGGREVSADGFRPAVVVLDAETLEVRARIATVSPSDVRWVFSTALGEVYIGTRTTIEVWSQTADGQYLPTLVSSAIETLDSERPALLGPNLVVLDNSTRPVLLPLYAGAPAAIEYPDGAAARQMLAYQRIGNALLMRSENRLLVLGPTGEWTGVDSSAWEDTSSFAIKARRGTGELEILQINLQQPQAELGKIRYQSRCLIERLDPLAGLRNLGGTFELQARDSKVSRAAAFDGWLLLSNAQGTIAVALPSEPGQP